MIVAPEAMDRKRIAGTIFDYFAKNSRMTTQPSELLQIEEENPNGPSVTMLRLDPERPAGNTQSVSSDPEASTAVNVSLASTSVEIAISVIPRRSLSSVQIRLPISLPTFVILYLQ